MCQTARCVKLLLARRLEDERCVCVTRQWSSPAALGPLALFAYPEIESLGLLRGRRL